MLLSIWLIVSHFQPSVAYKSVAYEISGYLTMEYIELNP